MGNISMVERQKKKDYFATNPFRCLHCDGVLKIPDGLSMKRAETRKYCDISCAARHQPPKKYHHKSFKGQPREENCRRCGKKNENRSPFFCNPACGSYGLNLPLTTTKGELFQGDRSWQTSRNIITRHARGLFRLSNPSLKCAACPYTNHIEVAHIRPVADFPETSTIAEINDPANLIGLCPNHHWEFDNGLWNLNTPIGLSARG